MPRRKERRERSPDAAVRKRRASHRRRALGYYREDQWTPERLLDKGGKLALRLLALNQVLHEKMGIRFLAPSTASALKQLTYQDSLSRPQASSVPTVSK